MSRRLQNPSPIAIAAALAALGVGGYFVYEATKPKPKPKAKIKEKESWPRPTPKPYVLSQEARELMRDLGYPGSLQGAQEFQQDFNKVNRTFYENPEWGRPVMPPGEVRTDGKVDADTKTAAYSALQLQGNLGEPWQSVVAAVEVGIGA